METWLQSSDLSTQNLKADVHSVLDALESHDWLAENLAMEQLEKSGSDSCPAGIGIVRGDGQILHICPSRSTALVHHHVSTRFLGFLWRRPVTRTAQAVPLSDLPRLIRIFISGGSIKLGTAA